MSRDGCVFCAIIAGIEPAIVARIWPDAIAIVPTGGVNKDHFLVIPTVHVEDVASDPAVSAAVMHRAAELAQKLKPCHIIANCGEGADQTVFHLHLHVIGRYPGLPMLMPWTETTHA